MLRSLVLSNAAKNAMATRSFSTHSQSHGGWRDPSYWFLGMGLSFYAWATMRLAYGPDVFNFSLDKTATSIHRRAFPHSDSLKLIKLSTWTCQACASHCKPYKINRVVGLGALLRCDVLWCDAVPRARILTWAHPSKNARLMHKVMQCLKFSWSHLPEG